MQRHPSFAVCRRAVVILWVIFPAALPAQAAVATFQGQVTDSEGAPIPGVEVEIATLRGPPLAYQGTTNQQGEVRVPLPVQTNDLRYRLSKEGYQTLEGAIESGRLWSGESTHKQDFVLTLDDGSENALVQLAAGEGEHEIRGSARAAYNEAAERFNAGDLEGAAEGFRKALKDDPRLPAAHIALAEIYLRREEPERAVESAQLALEDQPQDRHALEIRYDALLLLEQREAAEETLERLVQLGGVPQLAVRVFNLGVEAMRAGDDDQAISRFEQAVRLDAELLPAREALTSLYLRQGRLEDAAGQAREILAEDPLNPVGERALEEASRAAGKVAQDSAVEGDAKTRDGAAGGAEPEAAGAEVSEVDQAITLLEEGEPERARELLETVLESEPKHALAHYHLARYFIGAGDNAQAKRLLQRFLKLAPELREAERARQLLAVL